MKKKTFVVIILLLALISGGVAVATRSKQLSTEEMYTNAGRYFGEYIRGELDDGEFLIKSERISISKAQVDSIMKQYEQNQIAKSREDVIKSLLRQQALNVAAISAGFSTTDEEIQEALNLERRSFETAENRDDFLTYLKAAELTENEYWEMQYDNIRKRLILHKYWIVEEEKILKDYGAQFAEGGFYFGGDFDETQRALDKRMDEIVNQILQEEKIDLSSVIKEISNK